MNILYFFKPEDSRYLTNEGVGIDMHTSLRSLLKTIFWLGVSIFLVVLIGH